MQRGGNLTAHALDAAHGLDVELLRRQLQRGVARVDTGKLDVLTDGISQNLTVARHGIEVNLLGVLNELRHDDGVVLADVGSQLQEATELILVGADVHGSP